MLEEWGWRDTYQALYAPYQEKGLQAARVTAVFPDQLEIETREGQQRAILSASLRDIGDPLLRPTVGDWVVGSYPAEGDVWVVNAVLPRQTVMARKSPAGAAQLLAANVDFVLIATSANAEFNPSRLERYMALAWDCGAQPVLILTKIDQADEEDLDDFLDEMESLANGVPIHAVSAYTGLGLEELAPYVGTGQTVVLLGSSGVGKSTLINALADEALMETREISSDGQRGRHTTTYRQLLRLSDGGCLIDTPGMRELSPLLQEEGLAQTFDDIERLGEGCRYRNCKHQNEPGCAVREAIGEGHLSERRLKNYKKLYAEQDRMRIKGLADEGEGYAKYDLRQREKAFGKMTRQAQAYKMRRYED